MKTDQDVLDQANEIARRLYSLRGYAVKAGYRFDLSTHPHEKEAWNGACVAMEYLTDTNPNDAADNLEE